jgi:anti-repressor protein
MTNELSIEVITKRGSQLVSARKLYETLEGKERFSKWWNRMVSYGFKEGVDFMVCTKKYRTS